MKVAVIVSGEFGDLGNALYFLAGLRLHPAPVVLVPDSLRGIDGTVGSDIRHYGSLADVLAHLTSYRPDRVLLISGYLLTIGPRLSWLSFWRLRRFLTRHGVPVATTDPFLGLLRDPFAIDFGPLVVPPHRGRRGWLAAMYGKYLALRLYVFHLMLKRELHLYPAPFPAVTAPGASPTACYYNPETTVFNGPAGPPDGAGTWVFVLAQVDLTLQRKRYGDSFLELLARRLQEAAAAGRHPVAIVPPAIVAPLQRLLPGNAGVEVVGRIPFQRYMQVLLEAECAFFWNYLSFSIIHRVIQHRPVLFFDRGHMVELLPDNGAKAMDAFYLGWQPPLLDLGAPLEPRQLESLQTETRERFQRMDARLRECPTPTQVLEAMG